MRQLNIRTQIPDFQIVRRLQTIDDALLHQILPAEIWKKARQGLSKLGVFTLGQLRSGHEHFLKPVLPKQPQWLKSVSEFLTDSLGNIYKQFRGPQSIIQVAVAENPIPYTALFNLLPSQNAEPQGETCYTDGSFQSGSPILGCAAVFENRQIASKLTRHGTMSCSSTTAELGGLLLALQNSRLDGPLTIHTDSQACIGKISSYQSNSSTRNALREPDNDILDSLLALQVSRTSPCKIKWIKGHAGNAQNEAADRLANAVRSKDDNHSLIIADITSIQFRLGCSSGYLNEYPRQVLKKQSSLAHNNCFLTSSHFSRLPRDPAKAAVTIECLKSCELAEPRLLTSASNSTFRAFRYKFIADLLPIGSRLKRWGCLANPSGVCRRCELEEETLAHLTSCPSISINFNEHLIEQVESILGLEKSKCVIQKLRSCPIQLSVFDGTLNNSLCAAILALDELPFSFTFLCKIILKSMWKTVYFNVWLPRCQSTIQKERLLGIPPRLKRQYRLTGTSPRPTTPSRALKFGISLDQDRACWKSTFSG
jgi:ribonuclease HI